MLGAMLVSGNAVATVSELLQPEDFYRRSHATIYRTILEMYGRGRERRLDHAHERALQPRPARRGGRQGGRPHAGGDRAGGGERAPLRPDRPRHRHLPRPDPGGHRDRRSSATSASASRPSWSTAPSRSCSGSPTSASPATSRTWRRCSSSRSTGSRRSQNADTRPHRRTVSGFRACSTSSRPGSRSRTWSCSPPGRAWARRRSRSTSRPTSAIRERIPVAIFSLEMSREEVTTRLMCAEGKVDSKRLRRGKLWTRATGRSSPTPPASSTTPRSSSTTPPASRRSRSRPRARRLKSRLEGQLGLVIVDYLQLMGGTARVENRVQEISQISRSLKLIARDLDVPVLAISQLSRAVERAPTSGRSSPTCASRARSSRTPTSCCSSTATTTTTTERRQGHGRAHPRQAPERPTRQGPARLHRPLHQVRQPGPRRRAAGVARCR